MINKSISSSESVNHHYYVYRRDSLVSLLKSVPNRILEIGCGTGETLKHLKRIGAKSVTGIEIRCEVADKARESGEIDSIIHADFMDDQAVPINQQFDLIILSHVLEHFPDPVAVLHKVKRMMLQNSTLLVAVPNVRHGTVSVPLLITGKFDYTDSGILDHTHFRLYTKSSILSLLNQCGFHVEEAQMDFAGPRARNLNRISFGILSEIFGFAINVKAKKVEDRLTEI